MLETDDQWISFNILHLNGVRISAPAIGNSLRTSSIPLRCGQNLKRDKKEKNGWCPQDLFFPSNISAVFSSYYFFFKISLSFSLFPRINAENMVVPKVSQLSWQLNSPNRIWHYFSIFQFSYSENVEAEMKGRREIFCFFDFVYCPEIDSRTYNNV